MREYIGAGFLLDEPGSEAITYVNQDEVLRKKLLRELRDGVHSEKHTYKLGRVYAVWAPSQGI
jgi:hypothetical protein